MSKSKLPRLPKAGDTSIAAVGKRLEYVRKDEGYSVAKAAERADTTPAHWRAWERGRAAIPPRNAWIIVRNTCGSVEWLLTGYSTEHPVPAVLPALGDDLSGFAARVKEARQRLGFTIADIDCVSWRRFGKREWLQWESAQDEPDHENAFLLASYLEVSVEWLFTDTEPAKPAKPGKRYQADLYAGTPNDCTPGGQLKRTREAAGLSLKDVALLTGRFLTAKKLAQLESGMVGLSDLASRNLHLHAKNYALTLAMLYGVPLEELLFSEDELANVRRRVERLRRRFGLPGPQGKRKGEAA